MINEGKRMRKCAIIKRVSETRLISLWELEARPREEETPSREHISSRRIKRGKNRRMEEVKILIHHGRH